jgi:hypothetical protein
MKHALASMCVLVLVACAPNRSVPDTKYDGSFNPLQFAKTDIDRVAEAQQREIFGNLRILMEKLYRRNPRELKKGGHLTVADGVARVFEGHHQWRFAELKGARDTQAIQLAFRDDYQGDRVFAFVAGLASMMQTAFNNKTEFFITDDLDAQALYNAARNVEIAVWKLSNNRNTQGQLFLISNEVSGPIHNLSYEREFGKIIGSLDVLSRVMVDKGNRTIVKVMQTLASAVFLPVK